MLQEEKRKNLEALSDERGVINAMAMDQRGSLVKAIAAEKGVEQHAVTVEMLAEFKSAVVRILSPHASAVLLDPEYGREAAKERAHGCGLLLAYEKSGYDNTQPGRMPDLLENVSAQRIKEWGANAVKLLLYYTPFEDAAVNEKKREFVARVGKECAQAGIAFFLECVGYDPVGGDEKGLDYAKQKPDIVRRSMEEFSKERYGVDILKVEIPVNLVFVEDTGAFKGVAAYTKAQALAYYRQAAAAAKNPFIYLSAGVSNAQFTESLRLAAEAGAPFSGVLCGRATWKEGIPVYAKEGISALEKWLQSEGVKNIQAVNACLRAAVPWHTIYEA